MKGYQLLLANAVCVALFAPSAFADRGDGEGRERRGPPQEAIDACAALVEGDACSFTGRRDKEMTGTCFAPSESTLACKPDNFKKRRHHHHDHDHDTDVEEETETS